MKKLNTRAGFTLAELLIVVAIIAILVAIGVPVFSTSMERSRETVDLSNIRGAYAEFVAGTLGGRADTAYYQVDIKQRDVSSWVADASGFLANVINTKMPTASESGITNVTIGATSKDKLKTGNVWVKFTFVDPTDSTEKTLLKTPAFSFVELKFDETSGAPQPPAGVHKSNEEDTDEETGTTTVTAKANVIECYDEAEIDSDKRTNAGHWYLTKEQK